MQSAGLEPGKVEIPNIDESVHLNERPLNYVRRMAIQKAEQLFDSHQAYLITADTVVLAGKRILHKTQNPLQAEKYLKLLSGRRHSVVTVFCIRHKYLIRTGLVRTILKMKVLSKEEINYYLDTREWVGSAGAYSIQGKAICFFPFISGCFSNIIGLPLPRLIGVLGGMGYNLNKNE